MFGHRNRASHPARSYGPRGGGPDQPLRVAVRLTSDVEALVRAWLADMLARGS